MKTASKPGAARAPLSITAVAGSDEAAVKAAARDLAQRLAPPDADEFGLEIIDGCAENAGAAATRIHEKQSERLRTLPFFGGAKLVWLKNANFLADNVLGKSAAVTEALDALTETLTAGLGPDVRFLLSAPDVDKRRSFYKQLAKVADLQVFDRLETKGDWEEQAAQIVETRALGFGLKCSEEARELLALLTGGDTRQVDNELEKLDLYLGAERRDLAADDVRRLVPLSRAGVIFELGSAIGQRDLNRALSLIEQLLRQGESAIGILLVAIIPTVRNLLLVKDLQVRHRLGRPNVAFQFAKMLERLPATATAHLPRKKDGALNAYALGFAAMEAHRFNLDELRAGMEACLRANVQLVSGQMDDRFALEQVVISTLAVGALRGGTAGGAI